MTAPEDKYQVPLSNLKQSGRCIFCYRNDDEIGPLMACDRFCAHFPCMAFNSRLSQYCMPEGASNVDLLGGFRTSEVLNAFIADRRNKCAVCNVTIKKIKSSDKREANATQKWTNPALFSNKGASAGCSLRQCRKAFHYPCAPIKKHYTKHKIDFYRIYCSEEHLERGKQVLKTEVKGMFVDKPTDAANAVGESHDEGQAEDEDHGDADDEDPEADSNDDAATVGDNDTTVDENDATEEEGKSIDDGPSQMDCHAETIPYPDSVDHIVEDYVSNLATLPKLASELKTSSSRGDAENTTKRRSGRLFNLEAEVKREVEEAEVEEDIDSALTVETEPVVNENVVPSKKRKPGRPPRTEGSGEQSVCKKRKLNHDGTAFKTVDAVAIKQEILNEPENAEDSNSMVENATEIVDDGASSADDAFGLSSADSASAEEDVALSFSMMSNDPTSNDSMSINNNTNNDKNDDPLEQMSAADSAIASLSNRSKRSSINDVDEDIAYRDSIRDDGQEAVAREDEEEREEDGDEEVGEEEDEEVGEEEDDESRDEGIFLCRIKGTIENQKNRAVEVALQSIGLEFFFDDDDDNSSDRKTPFSYSSPNFVSHSIRWPHCLPENLRQNLPSHLRKYFLLEMLDNLVRFPSSSSSSSSSFDTKTFLRHVFLNLSAETIEEWRGIDEIERKLAAEITGEGGIGVEEDTEEEGGKEIGMHRRSLSAAAKASASSSSSISSKLDDSYRRAILSRVSSLCRRRHGGAMAELTPSGRSFVLRIGAALDPFIEMRRRLVLTPDVKDVVGEEEKEEEKGIEDEVDDNESTIEFAEEENLEDQKIESEEKTEEGKKVLKETMEECSEKMEQVDKALKGTKDEGAASENKDMEVEEERKEESPKKKAGENMEVEKGNEEEPRNEKDSNVVEVMTTEVEETGREDATMTNGAESDESVKHKDSYVGGITTEVEDTGREDATNSAENDEAVVHRSDRLKAEKRFENEKKQDEMVQRKDVESPGENSVEKEEEPGVLQSSMEEALSNPNETNGEHVTDKSNHQKLETILPKQQQPKQTIQPKQQQPKPSLTGHPSLLGVFSESDFLLNYLYLFTKGFNGITLRVLDVGGVDNPLHRRFGGNNHNDNDNSHGTSSPDIEKTESILDDIIAGIHWKRLPCSGRLEDLTDIAVVMPVNPNLVSASGYVFAAIREAFGRGLKALRKSDRDGEEQQQSPRKTAFVITPKLSRDFLKTTLSEFVAEHEHELEMKLVTAPFRYNRVCLFQLNFS